ncbi:MAG: hypothetical protein HYS80_02450 [Candidatus Aenigmarchaeota archaeon]|nr:hypothetical protein [Candidatus Aenigmarchaeota archaeon]
MKNDIRDITILIITLLFIAPNIFAQSQADVEVTALPLEVTSPIETSQSSDTSSLIAYVVVIGVPILGIGLLYFGIKGLLKSRNKKR